MDEIVDPNSSFDFSILSCISPTSIAGGNYFIRILKNPGQNPLYIQPPKCTTKQGVVKTGKKLVCDLLFKHEDESFTEFLGSLETFCRNQIFQNKDKWFDSELSEPDIEESFSPTAKLYKSGKLHSVRVNLPIRLGKCSLKIFNEDEEDVDIENIKETTQIMTILEIQGIRCSARNFQIELEMKQMMVLNPVNLFETCIFTKTNKASSPVIKPVPLENDMIAEPEEKMKVLEDLEDLEEDIPSLSHINPELNSDSVTILDLDLDSTLVEDYAKTVKINGVKESLADSSGLDEVNLEVPDEKGEMKLKKRNYVYYNMYTEAKRKARIARDFAIASYLEAKQIRHNFLEEADLSEDDDILANELENLENSKE